MYFTDGYFVDWHVINSSVSRYLKFIENINTIGRIYDTTFSNMTGLFPQAHRCLTLLACKIHNFTTKCVKGHKGFLCADCIEGYHNDGNVCSICPSKKETTIHISVTIVLLILLLLLVIALVLMKSDKEQLNRLLSYAKICINYFYFSSKMYSIMTFIDWPNSMRKFINFLKWFEFNPLVLLSVTCWLSKFTVYDSFTYFMSINGCIVLMAVISVCSLRLGNCLGVLRRKMSKRYQKSLIAIAFVSIFFLYPPTSISIVQLLPVACKAHYLSFPDQFEVFYFMQDPALQCFTAYHRKIITYVYMSLIYVLGIPVAIPIVIWYLRRRFSRKAMVCLAKGDNNDQEVLEEHSCHISDAEDKANENLSISRDIYDGLQFFYGNYKDQYFFWESFEMTKKMFLAAIAVFIGERSYTSIALLIMFSGVFAVLHAHFQPIANTVEHFLQLLCLSSLHIHLLLGLSMKMESKQFMSDIKQDTEALTVTLIICNVTVLLLVSGKPHFLILYNLIHFCFRSVDLTKVRSLGYVLVLYSNWIENYNITQ